MRAGAMEPMPRGRHAGGAVQRGPQPRTASERSQPWRPASAGGGSSPAAIAGLFAGYSTTSAGAGAGQGRGGAASAGARQSTARSRSSPQQEGCLILRSAAVTSRGPPAGEHEARRQHHHHPQGLHRHSHQLLRLCGEQVRPTGRCCPPRGSHRRLRARPAAASSSSGGLYPPEAFRPQKAFGISVMVSTDPGLSKYLTTVLQQMSGATRARPAAGAIPGRPQEGARRLAGGRRPAADGPGRVQRQEQGRPASGGRLRYRPSPARRTASAPARRVVRAPNRARCQLGTPGAGRRGTGRRGRSLQRSRPSSGRWARWLATARGAPRAVASRPPRADHGQHHLPPPADRPM